MIKEKRSLEEARRALREKLSQSLRLESIEFTDGGNSQSNYAEIAVEALQSAPNAHVEKTPVKMPVFAPRRVQDIASATPEAFSDPLKGYKLYKVMGRTLVYRNKEGRYIAFKFLKEGEEAGKLLYESEFFDFLNALKEKGINLKGYYPKALPIERKRVVRLDTEKLPKIISETLSSVKSFSDKPGEPVLPDKTQGYYTVMAYATDSPDYFTYLHEASDNLVEESQERNMHDLFTLARYGVVHPDIIELFHNVIQRGRTDRGRYLWMVDIIRPMRTRQGAGRLHAWERAVAYPNMRISGPADFAEMVSIDELVSLGHPHSLYMQNNLQRFHPEDRKKFLLVHYVGNYLLALALTEGKRLNEKGVLNWRKPEKLAALMKKTYATAYKAFTLKEDDPSDVIDWTMLARQMLYFMGKDYVIGLMKKELPDGIYPAYTHIRYPDNVNRLRGWVRGLGWKFDGENDDLGPVNGPLPFQELIKANCVYTMFMVSDMALRPRPPTKANGSEPSGKSEEKPEGPPAPGYGEQKKHTAEETVKKRQQEVLSRYSFVIHEPLEWYMERELPAAMNALETLVRIRGKTGRPLVIFQNLTLGQYYPPMSEALRKHLGVVELTSEEFFNEGDEALTQKTRGANFMLVRQKISSHEAKSLDISENMRRIWVNLERLTKCVGGDLVMLDHNGPSALSSPQGKIDMIYTGSKVILNLENGFEVPPGVAEEKGTLFILNPALRRDTGRSTIDDRPQLCAEENISFPDDDGNSTTLNAYFYGKFADRVCERFMERQSVERSEFDPLREKYIAGDFVDTVKTRALAAKKRGEKIIIGFETEWLYALGKQRGSAQRGATQNLTKQIQRLQTDLQKYTANGHRLDNIEIVFGRVEDLGQEVLARAKETNTPYSNITVLGTARALSAPEFQKLKSTPEKENAFLVEINPSRLAQKYEELNVGEELYIRFVEMMMLAVKLSSAKEISPQDDILKNTFIAIRQKEGEARFFEFIPIPQAEPVDVKELRKRYEIQRAEIEARA